MGRYRCVGKLCEGRVKDTGACETYQDKPHTYRRLSYAHVPYNNRVSWV